VGGATVLIAALALVVTVAFIALTVAMRRRIGR
jgi:hypothetical protein